MAVFSLANDLVTEVPERRNARGDVDVPRKAQIVVVGGGVLGTSAAFDLAAAGQQRIVLLNRGPIAVF